MTQKRAPLAVRYGVAIAATLLAVAFRWSISPLVGDTAALLPFTPSVMISAWYGGIGPGLLATVLGALAGNYLWQDPAFTLGIDDLSELVSVTLFLTTGILISALNEAVHQARRKAEANAVARQQSEERFRLLVDGVRDYAIFMLDPAGRVVNWTAGAQRVLGYEPAEVTGQCFSLFFTDDDRRAGLPDREIEIATAEGRFETEGWRVRRDNSLFWANIVLTALRGPDGRLTGFAKIARDVTERKEAQEQLLASRQRLQELSAHLQSVREEERTRIAREIHDELGQTLTVLKMQISWLQSKVGPADTALAEGIRAALGDIDATIQTVRRICSDLRPSILDELGITAAIEWLVNDFQTRTDILCDLAEVPPIALDGDRSTALFRILQEALTNVLRHSGATQVEIVVDDEPNRVVLSVRDNGRGIADGGSSGAAAFGILGMRERARAFGGDVEIGTAPGGGTLVQVELPRATPGAPAPTSVGRDETR